MEEYKHASGPVFVDRDVNLLAGMPMGSLDLVCSLGLLLEEKTELTHIRMELAEARSKEDARDPRRDITRSRQGRLCGGVLEGSARSVAPFRRSDQVYLCVCLLSPPLAYSSMLTFAA